MKTLMILGGSRYILPLIKKAHEYGVFVITCDYLPDNIAHKYSDLYVNISILDKDKVLEAAKRFNIDGISSFACDPGVVTAAYVAEKLQLPSCGPLVSVMILQNKGLFRDFLTKNGFNVPKMKTYATIEEAINEADDLPYPVIVKPTDSAGSKGVKKVSKAAELKTAVESAFDNSFKKEIIIEEFIESAGCPSDSDCYSVNGDLKFVSFSDQHFDKNSVNPFVPCGFVWPTSMPLNCQKELADEIQRAIKLLKMKSSIYNVETRVSKNGKPYIMEISPRGGGNRISEMLYLHSGADLIERHLKDCLGIEASSELEVKKNVRIGEIILHCNKDGLFENIRMNLDNKNILLEKDLWIKKNTTISSFTGANKAIGTIVLKMGQNDDLENIKNNIEIETK